MQAAFALAGGSTPRRPRDVRRPWILLVSAGAHLLVLAGLIAGAHVMPQLVEPPAISVELLTPSTPPETVSLPVEAKPVAPPQAAPRAATPSRTTPAAPSAQVPVVRPSTPAAPVGAVAPPGFKARQLTGGGDALREAARDGIGCRNADELALTKAERAACAEALGEKAKNAPFYAVIDPDKKAAFDKTCKKDDDWCLYRTGKGPYPGLFALGKKKKRPGWDD
jgi:hypothetical protein